MGVGVKEDHNEEGGDPSETGTADDFCGVFGTQVMKPDLPSAVASDMRPPIQNIAS